MNAPGRAAGALVGAVAGVLSGMLGIGGGLVVTPVLALRGVPLRRATGTALGAVLVCALVAVATDALTEPAQLDLLAAALVAAGAQGGVLVGRRLLAGLPDAGLRAVFLVFLLFAAGRALGLFEQDGFAAELRAAADEVARAFDPSAAVVPRDALTLAAVVMAGVAAGVSAVLFGIGGGVVVVPVLVLLGADFAAAAAVSLLAMVPTALAGLRVAKRDDRIERGLLGALLPAAAAGAVVGVWLRNRALDAAMLETIFGGFLVYAAARLWMTRPRKG